MQEHADKCKYTCCCSYAYLPAYTLLNGHTHVHRQSIAHRGAVNLGRADEKGSRGYGESVSVGVAVTVTGLGGLACLANTRSDVERGAVFYQLQNAHEFLWKMLKGHVVGRHNKPIPRNEIEF